MFSLFFVVRRRFLLLLRDPNRRLKVIGLLQGFGCISYYTLRLDQCFLEEQIHVWVESVFISRILVVFAAKSANRRQRKDQETHVAVDEYETLST